MSDQTTDQADIYELLGGLISHLHVPRSMGSFIVPPEYDKVRDLIGDFGWSDGPEIAVLLRRHVKAEPPREGSA